MARVLVAGATGYLGGFVVRELKQRGHFVRVLARSGPRADSLRVIADEVFSGEVTRPETLAGVCDGIDRVFSCLGSTSQKSKLSFRDIDYLGNKNLLDAARAAGAQKFVYVSVFHGRQNRHLAIVDAHEEFADALRASGLAYAIIRPTGYYSDMGQFFEMAKGGRVFLFGRGDNRINPIHGADLARVCADAFDGDATEIDVGGPEVLSYVEVAQAAFAALSRPPRISRMPLWLIRFVVAVAKVFSRRQGEVLAFLTTMMTTDMIAPRHGSILLGDHYSALAAGGTTGTLASAKGEKS